MKHTKYRFIFFALGGCIIFLFFLFITGMISQYTNLTPILSSQPVKNQWRLVSETGKNSSRPKSIPPAGYEEYTQSGIGNIIYANDESSIRKLTNSKILLRGMVLHWDKLKADEVIIYRMMITCCAADGMPLGILVKLPGNMNFNDRDWIQAEGTVQLRPFTDEIRSIEPVAVTVPLSSQYPYFTATKAYKIDVPAEPYLFP
jgi:uncharacterized membrane protein YcgQ (UPF0703/DUF1980 family)